MEAYFAKVDAWGAARLDGYELRSWLSHHMDYSIYIAAGYLTFVFIGPSIVKKLLPPTKPSVFLLKKLWMLWNLFLSFFSLYGASRVVPAALENFKSQGMDGALCNFRKTQFYESNVGFCIALFTLSKLPEFIDTVFLILTGKYQLPFLSWFHHVTTFLFAWFAYQTGTSIFIYAAAMNYSVHTIMYAYFTLTEAGFKHLVKPIGVYITLLQILQMIGGMFVSAYVVVQKIQALRAGEKADSRCTGTSFLMARTQLVIYICNFYLFSDMFYNAYVKKRPARAELATETATAAAKKKK